MVIRFENLFIVVALILIGTFVFLSYRVFHAKSNTGPLPFVILGMLICSVSGFLVFFNMDNTKGWNPYGWWFMSTFLSAIVGGLLGMLVFGILSKKKPRV